MVRSSGACCTAGRSASASLSDGMPLLTSAVTLSVVLVEAALQVLGRLVGCNSDAASASLERSMEWEKTFARLQARRGKGKSCGTGNRAKSALKTAGKNLPPSFSFRLELPHLCVCCSFRLLWGGLWPFCLVVPTIWHNFCSFLFLAAQWLSTTGKTKSTTFNHLVHLGASSVEFLAKAARLQELLGDITWFMRQDRHASTSEDLRLTILYHGVSHANVPFLDDQSMSSKLSASTRLHSTGLMPQRER